MKLKLFYLGIILFSIKLSSQITKPTTQQKELVADLPLYNFFYLSKYLDNRNLKPEQRNAVYGQFFSKLGAQKLQELSASQDVALARLRKVLNLAIVNSPAHYTFTNYLKVNNINEFRAKFKLEAEHEKTVKEIEAIIKEIDFLENEKIKRIQINTDNQKDILKQIQIITADTISSVMRQEVQTLQQKLLDDSKDVENLNAQTDVKKREKADLLMKKIEKFSSEYFGKYPERAIATETIQDAQKFYGGTEIAKTLQYTNNYVQSIQGQGSSGFQLPSQSQLIDAMALFLANRAKQEAAIWFMDQVRTRLQNPLISAAFPETIKLIGSLEDYKVPNFGTKWRYAISSDFIGMPEYIAESEWIKLTIGEENDLNKIKSSIKLGYKLNRLMASNFNYRDLIESLYLDELKADTTSYNSFDNNIQNSITLLYALTKELYSIDYLSDKPNYRLLNYEEINSLDQEQWKILKSLIYLKYFYTAEKSDNIGNDFFNDSLNSNSIKVVISQILVNLSQFDKIRNDLANVNASEKPDYSKQNFYSTWKIIEQTLDNLNEICLGDVSKCNSVKNTNKIIHDNLKTTMHIYESLQSHDFNGIIQNTFTLINQFKKNDIIIVENDYELTHMPGNKYSLKKNNRELYIWKTDNGFTISKDSTDQKDKFIINNFNQFKRLWNLTSFNKSDAKELLKQDIVNKKEYDKILRQFEFEPADLIKIIDSVQNNKISNNKASASKTATDHSAYVNKLDIKYRDQLIKLTSFFGDILTATNSEQMADVISSHALPPTSYKLKRRVPFSIDFNAYVGAYGAYSFPSSGSTFNEGWTGGITAPIGITFTWQIGKQNWGISANVVDLGNIVNHYLASSEKYYKDVHFSEVFAPNANILYSIPKTPLVAFIGASFLPLKSITVDGMTKNYRAFDLTLFQAGIKIDIPLVNLHKSQ